MHIAKVTAHGNHQGQRANQHCGQGCARQLNRSGKKAIINDIAHQAQHEGHLPMRPRKTAQSPAGKIGGND